MAHNDLTEFGVLEKVDSLVLTLNGFGRLLQHVQDGVLQGEAPNVGTVPFAGRVVVFRAAALFVARFVEVGIGHEDEALNADQDLQHGRFARLPARTLPGAQQRQTDFAALVEVGIEADSSATGGEESDFGRLVRVILQVEVKEKTAIRVGCAFGA